MLSKTTADTDTVDKNLEYRGIASLQHYLMLAQTSRAGILHMRTAEGWRTDTIPADGTIALSAIGVDVPMTEAYAGLDIP